MIFQNTFAGNQTFLLDITPQGKGVNERVNGNRYNCVVTVYTLDTYRAYQA